ncbi:MAG TPA: PilZ domain-containing protein [Myxococcales bacterium]|nr:PilZ domain-containing protein [Myxococcales bacterium]
MSGDKPKDKDRRRFVGDVKDERRRTERRAEARVPVDLWVESEEGEATYFQRAGNLSAGGAYFTQTMPHPVGTKVRLRFSLPDGPEEIQCAGQIVSAIAEGDPGMGVKFIDLDPKIQARIRALAAQLARKG